jgi:hypothetical protein
MTDGSYHTFLPSNYPRETKGIYVHNGGKLYYQNPRKSGHITLQDLGASWLKDPGVDRYE